MYDILESGSGTYYENTISTWRMYSRREILQIGKKDKRDKYVIYMIIKYIGHGIYI